MDVCRKLERYAHRFFAIAPFVIYALTYFLASAGVSCFVERSNAVFPIAVTGMRIYGLGFLFSGINIFASVRMMAYGKGYFSGMITFLSSFALLLLILNITLAALSVLCAARLTEYRNLLRTQEAADRWRGQSEERFAQVSAFLPVNETQDVSAVSAAADMLLCDWRDLAC